MARLALAVLAASAVALRPATTRVARAPTQRNLFGGAPPEEDTPASPPPGQGGGQTMSVPGLGDITEEEMKLAMEFRQKMAQKMQETRVEGSSLGGKVKVVYDGQGQPSSAVWKSKFYGAVVLNRRVGLHAIDATPARWRGDAGSSPPDRARTEHLTHWLISTQVAIIEDAEKRGELKPGMTVVEATSGNTGIAMACA